MLFDWKKSDLSNTFIEKEIKKGDTKTINVILFFATSCYDVRLRYNINNTICYSLLHQKLVR